MNLSESDIPEGFIKWKTTGINETYRGRFDATCFQVPHANEALCIVCI